MHDHHEFATPEGLTQQYVVCELDQKINFLWSFLCSHAKQKVLVFFSTCKQVRFFYNVLRRMQVPTTCYSLHSKMTQHSRMEKYELFNHSTAKVAMLATDLAARGLDFPQIDWVVQFDCPVDVETYIHRVGRTARFNKAGNAMLVLLPSEIKMVELLENNRVPLSQTSVNPNKLSSTSALLDSIMSEHTDTKLLAQSALVGYLRSVHLAKNKQVFDVHALDYEAFGRSLGLANVPVVQFKEKKEKKEKKSRTMERKVLEEKLKLVDQFEKEKMEREKKNGVEFEENQPLDEEDAKEKREISQLLKRKSTLFGAQDKFIAAGEEDDGFVALKRANHELEEEYNVDQLPADSNRDVSGQHVDFLEDSAEFEEARNEFVEEEKKRFKEQDLEDREKEKLKKREKKKKEMEKLKQKRRQAEEKMNKKLAVSEAGEMDFGEELEFGEDLGSISVDEEMEMLPPEELEAALIEKARKRNLIKSDSQEKGKRGKKQKERKANQQENSAPNKRVKFNEIPDKTLSLSEQEQLALSLLENRNK